MRRIVSLVIGSLVISVAATVAAFAIARRHDRRLGSGFTNRVVNPLLVRVGAVGGRRSDLGLIEHVGRRTGVHRITPVHPEPTEDGFRVLVPLGAASEWARNVLAAGGCRMQLHDVVYDLAAPTLVDGGSVNDLPRAVRGLLRAAGVDYLVLQTRDAAPGTLEGVTVGPPHGFVLPTAA